jgi:hypothetical protein
MGLGVTTTLKMAIAFEITIAFEVMSLGEMG